MTFSEQINLFNRELKLHVTLPEGVDVMNPYRDKEAYALSSAFYNCFYSDTRTRKLIVGINPGRLGGGMTGIPFTDPVKLEKICGIKNDLKKVTEPSAGFIYDMIDAYGGTEKFYNNYFIYAVCPLGFIKNGINHNYYDSKELEAAVTPFIVDSFKKILELDVGREVCYCLGNGKNFKYLDNLNKEHKFFERVVPLPHPRWIVQYRRKRYDEFIGQYLVVLDQC